jgi:putative peptide zinc metalloprotease protein
MSVTADPPVAPAAARALARAEGLELLGALDSAGYRAEASLVRRADGQMVKLGPLQYALLGALDGTRDQAALAAALTERLGRRVEAPHVVRIAEKLARQGLLAGTEANAPARSNPLLGLRWKVLVTDPGITRNLTRPFEVLFRPWILLPALLGFIAVCWFVLVEEGVARATAEAFARPELLLLVLGLTIGSAALHEIGHAAACRYGGGRPGGIGAGIYLVWPAFYTDVTDAYRLPRRDRLRTDLGGIYFNALVAVTALGVWLATGLDVLLLLIALQLLDIVRNLSPVIRADGYHVLSDATGVPDLYMHMGPTLRRLLPWKEQEPSALTGRARLIVTVWVLLIVPVLLGLAFAAILMFPKLAASAWASGSELISELPDQDVLGVLTSLARLVALTLPVLGVALIMQRLVTGLARKASSWSTGRPGRRGLVVAGAAGLATLLAWAWWPAGQYRPVQPTDRGTLVSVVRTIGAPASVARPPASAAAPRLAPGRHMAVALIPRGGATEKRPAVYVVNGGREGEERTPTILVSPTAPETAEVATAAGADAPSSGSAGGAAAAPKPAEVSATQLPFTLPDAPRKGDTQALAVNGKDGGVVYDVAYSVVTVTDGTTADNRNSAYALASCRGCVTLAASVQLVLIVGQTDRITPINVAEALNVQCPACITTAIARQLVVSVVSAPSEELLARLTEELRALDAIDEGDTPAEVLAQVNAVVDAVKRELEASGITYPDPTPTPEPAASAAPAASATPTPAETPAATPEATPTAAATASPTPTPAQTAPPAAEPTTEATPAAVETPAPTP